MNPKLEEVNELYLQIQNYIDPLPEYLTKLTNEERLEIDSHMDEYSRIYKIARGKFVEVASSLSSGEIIEGYGQGSRLLQRSLSGYMCHHFNDAYIPVMVESIRNGESHTAHLFLQSLADHLGRQIAAVVIEALDDKSALIRETSLAVVRQLRLVEAIDKIKRMVNDPNPVVSYLAQEILTSWEAK